jgi:hypothetical protein
MHIRGAATAEIGIVRQDSHSRKQLMAIAGIERNHQQRISSFNQKANKEGMNLARTSLPSQFSVDSGTRCTHTSSTVFGANNVDDLAGGSPTKSKFAVSVEPSEISSKPRSLNPSSLRMVGDSGKSGESGSEAVGGETTKWWRKGSGSEKEKIHPTDSSGDTAKELTKQQRNTSWKPSLMFGGSSKDINRARKSTNLRRNSFTSSVVAKTSSLTFPGRILP